MNHNVADLVSRPVCMWEQQSRFLAPARGGGKGERTEEEDLEEEEEEKRNSFFSPLYEVYACTYIGHPNVEMIYP